MNDAPVVLITNALHYVGPASVSRMSRNGARIVALVEFLATGDCGFVTGHVIPIAGGWA